MAKKPFIHPYIPNSVPGIKAEMMKEIGIQDIDELYSEIPDALKFKSKLNLPDPILSECELEQHVSKILDKNSTSREYLSFLGAGCYDHYVPAVCDEINRRPEFLTAYAGEPYEDHGRFQALFEYESMMAELLDMDVVNVPTYDWNQAASTAIRMAQRITGRNEAVVVKTINPDRLLTIKNYCHPAVKIIIADFDKKTGLADLEDLRKKISSNTAAVYFENPSFLGVLEEQCNEISELAKQNGALTIVGVDPISLGVIAPPSNYGADIVCGDVQSLGIHMNYGGGFAGFIATRDEEKFVSQYPSRLFGVTTTVVPGELGFGDVFYDRTSFAKREQGKEFVGTASALWGITAGVYLALMGPKGMEDIGKTILQKSYYGAKELAKVKNINSPYLSSAFFREFVVNFDDTGKTVEEINKMLLEKGIFGGKDLSQTFPELGQSALFCITERHTASDIHKLVKSIESILK
ncbi:hypothetical protein TSYNTROOL_19010 [Tepidanaerobacter syntrophicus]|uniref:Glycine dehydrogenase subunit 1 n=1 Tax=Tepidanaerobacter syntrophicus TaxID=224999 RepID=A0A0U9HGM3_9FIRM|nr:aminomethyl-transferring glycine dehydrogenase subunit GcvPA [Tepidanaerobacter syntrophicus]GAQ25044.1 glycine dehydrogenase subunit 1 [Tepidanaerobacter syntrophicus]GLI51815.1 hypothetical protein TSYNTROOL_19010 [Tepidanaerobacter syntrophicus]HHV83253.1 aminomethyl-transferring glycine dehydrogenase subunit GcvPA [Tepidanaerobacter syntrophicus]